MEGLTKTIPPFSFSLTPALPLSPSPHRAEVPTVSFSSALSFILNLRLSFASPAYFSLRVRDALGIREQSTLWFLRWDSGKRHWAFPNRSSVYPPTTTTPLLMCKRELCGRWCHFTPGVWTRGCQAARQAATKQPGITLTNAIRDVISFPLQWA